MELTVTNLSKTFLVRSGALFGDIRRVEAVRTVSFSVPSGTCLGIVGESGSGKTTIAKMLAGFLPADSGSAMLAGENLLAMKMRERATRVQMVFQDPFASINPKLVLSTQMREATGGDSAAAERWMTEVGLSADHLRRYPHQLSGGQRQRFAIARALAKEPALLLADEPVSSLDLSVQAQIINLLNSLRERRRFTQIVISHDLAVIANTCDHVRVMHAGDAVETGEVDTVLSRPSHPYTQRLLNAARAAAFL